MLINRRELLKTTALGTTSLAMMPSFNHLGASSNASNNDVPHRFVFIRKSNGNLTSQFQLPSFSNEELKLHEEKKAFEVDLTKHELPVWLNGLNDYKDDMTILHGISVRTVW